jgi:hypothetical protein
VLRVDRAVREGAAAFPFGRSESAAYGLGGMVEPDVACRSLEGAAFTVSLSDCFPLSTGERDSDAVEGCAEGLPLRVLARVYGCAESRAWVEETVRVDRRVGGIVVLQLFLLSLALGVGQVI